MEVPTRSIISSHYASHVIRAKLPEGGRGIKSLGGLDSRPPGCLDFSVYGFEDAGTTTKTGCHPAATKQVGEQDIAACGDQSAGQGQAAAAAQLPEQRAVAQHGQAVVGGSVVIAHEL